MEQASEDVTFIDLPRRRRSRLSRVARSRRSAGTKVVALGVKLCRPSETVLDLIPRPQLGEFRKEDGELVVDSAGHRVS